MNDRDTSSWVDILSWVLSLAIIGVIVAGAFLTLAVLRPDAESIQLEATDVAGMTSIGP